MVFFFFSFFFVPINLLQTCSLLEYRTESIILVTLSLRCFYSSGSLMLFSGKSQNVRQHSIELLTFIILFFKKMYATNLGHHFWFSLSLFFVSTSCGTKSLSLWFDFPYFKKKKNKNYN